MNHKAKRPRKQRAGCKMCKPHKMNRQAAHRLRDRRHDVGVEDFVTLKDPC